MRVKSWATLVVACVMAVSTAPAVAQSRTTKIDPAVRQALLASLERGAEYLRQNRKADGTWEDNPGITALAATALLKQTGKTPAQQYGDVSRALTYLKGLQKADGGIYIRDLPHYITAVSSMAFVAARRAEFAPVIDKARGFLLETLIDEGEGYTKKDKFYGGVGYGSDLRPDLANLEYALRALKEAGVPSDNAAWDKALVFLQRTQNLTEVNDQKTAGNDGGFVYYPGFTYATAGGVTSYGSMTYAGLLSYSYANVKKEDQRVQAALKWIRETYTVDENPGIGQTTVYYYYMVFAKALDAYGEDVIADKQGRRHVWRDDLGRKLMALQKPEGYWVNTADAQYLQDNKVLVTAFTMMAIEYLLQGA